MILLEILLDFISRCFDWLDEQTDRLDVLVAWFCDEFIGPPAAEPTIADIFSELDHAVDVSGWRMVP